MTRKMRVNRLIWQWPYGACYVSRRKSDIIVKIQKDKKKWLDKEIVMDKEMWKVIRNNSGWSHLCKIKYNEKKKVDV